MKNGNKIIALIIAFVLIVSFAFSVVSVVVKADSLIDFVIWYPLSDGSWGSYTLEEMPADTLLEIGKNAIYQEGIDEPLYVYPETYQKYTESYAALDGPSDSVSTVSYDLPLEMEANIGYIILHSLVTASPEEVEFSLWYPDSNGQMQYFTKTVLADTYIEITETGIYYESGEMLLRFGVECNAYRVSYVDYESSETPTGILPAQLTVYPSVPPFSVYNYIEPVEEVELSIYYPDSTGQMKHFTEMVLADTFIEITETGIYYESGEVLLEFGKKCNVYHNGFIADYDSTIVPTAALPVEFSVWSGFPTISVYNYAVAPVAPVIRYNADDDSITWNGDSDYKYQIKVEDSNGEERIFGTYGMTEYKIYPYDYVSEVGENTVYVRSLVYAGDDTRLPTYSEWSNGVLWTAALPSIDSFCIDGSILHYGFSGIHAVGSIKQNGFEIVADIEPGLYEYDLRDYSGLNGFSLSVVNKYGCVDSPVLDYYVGFANDDGTFYLIGDVMNQIYRMLDSVEFFGITLWAYLFSGFLITMIIPFLAMILIPSSGFKVRGGNSNKLKNKDDK